MPNKKENHEAGSCVCVQSYIRRTAQFSNDKARNQMGDLRAPAPPKGQRPLASLNPFRVGAVDRIIRKTILSKRTKNPGVCTSGDFVTFCSYFSLTHHNIQPSFFIHLPSIRDIIALLLPH